MSDGPLRIVTLELGPFAAHCLIVVDEASSEAMVVDPGFEPGEVVAALQREGLKPGTIVLTHAHIDHAYGVATLKRAFPRARFLVHPAEVPLLQAMPAQASMFSVPEPERVEPDGLLVDGGVLRLGEQRLIVRHTPGHSPGHVVLIHDDPAQPFAIVGDVLFAGAVGRTDLWGGSFEQLERSIREVLYTLPAHTRVIPGHDEETTIGVERDTNPFVTE